jgi:hypothetical protein
VVTVPASVLEPWPVLSYDGRVDSSKKGCDRVQVTSLSASVGHPRFDYAFGAGATFRTTLPKEHLSINVRK